MVQLLKKTEWHFLRKFIITYGLAIPLLGVVRRTEKSKVLKNSPKVEATQVSLDR